MQLKENNVVKCPLIDIHRSSVFSYLIFIYSDNVEAKEVALKMVQ